MGFSNFPPYKKCLSKIEKKNYRNNLLSLSFKMSYYVTLSHAAGTLGVVHGLFGYLGHTSILQAIVSSLKKVYY